MFSFDNALIIRFGDEKLGSSIGYRLCQLDGEQTDPQMSRLEREAHLRLVGEEEISFRVLAPFSSI